MSNNKACKKTSIGGQAVLEGIMMRGPKKSSLAVRMPDNTISIEEIPAKSIKEKFKPLGWPFIRGVVGMIESFTIGYKALMKSAEKIGLEEEEKAEKEKKLREKAIKKAKKQGLPIPQFDDPVSEEVPVNDEGAPTEKAGKKSDDNGFFAVIMTVASVLGVALALVLFMWLPAFLFNLLNNHIFPGVDLIPFKGMFEGVIKIIIFLTYIFLVALMKDIHRTFQYHGAEHKTIFCYENGEELTVENVRKFKRFHPRCGTSFLILMLVVSILISTIVLFIFPKLNEITWLWVIIKILLLPVMCSVGYELIKLCGRHDNVVTRVISAPGLWVQRLTTKEPDDSMIEVAIAALKDVIPENPDDDKL